MKSSLVQRNHNHLQPVNQMLLQSLMVFPIMEKLILWLVTFSFNLIKVSKSQNKFIKSSFLPKNERIIARISALNVRAEILAIFCSFFGRNNDLIHLFWDLLTFKTLSGFSWYSANIYFYNNADFIADFCFDDIKSTKLMYLELIFVEHVVEGLA